METSNLGCLYPKTRIQDLPDECLSIILSRIGSSCLPIQSVGTRVENAPVTHPIQCSLVCKHWRTLIPPIVQSLTLDMNLIAIFHHDAKEIGKLYPNISSLTLTKGPRSFVGVESRDPLAALEHISKHLKALTIMFPLRPKSVKSLVRIIDTCHSLQKLWLPHPQLSLPPIYPAIAKEQAWLNAACQLTSLNTLSLRYCGRSSDIVLTTLCGMSALQELHLESDDVPQTASLPPACHRLLGMVRSLVWSWGDDQLPCTLDHLTGLEALTLRDWIKHSQLPFSLGCLLRLTRLELNVMSLTVLPDSLGQLSSLQMLTIMSCMKLSKLPDALGSLSSLQVLKVEDCESLKALPEAMWELTRLHTLQLAELGTSLQALPVAIAELKSMSVLRVKHWEGFRRLPETVGELHQLRTLEVEDCTALPESLRKLTNLRVLHAEGGLRSLPGCLGQLGRLRSLRLITCSLSQKLEELPDSLWTLSNLVELELRGWHVERVPESVSALSNLEVCRLGLPCASVLAESLFQLRRLRVLELELQWIRKLPGAIGDLQRLEELVLKMPWIRSLPKEMCRLERLRHLTLERCAELRGLPGGFARWTESSNLAIRGCRFLRVW